MVQPDWPSAEEALFVKSAAIIRQFADEHADESFSAFAFTVDSDFAGVALNFDTLKNSLAGARREERYQIERRNSLFATDDGWQDALYTVAHHTNRVDDCNLRGSFAYDLVEFVGIPAWEDYSNRREESEGAELEGRIIVSIHRVVERLVASGVFGGLRQSSYFRVAFGFHDSEMIVLRVLNRPGP